MTLQTGHKAVTILKNVPSFRQFPSHTLLLVPEFLTLEQSVGVRIPAPQPTSPNLPENREVRGFGDGAVTGCVTAASPK